MGALVLVCGLVWRRMQRGWERERRTYVHGGPVGMS